MDDVCLVRGAQCFCYLTRDPNGLFAERDRDALRVLAASAALAIRNATLTRTLIAQQRLQRELELVAELQVSLLPDRQAAEFPVHGVNIPARTVSGDFYDFFTIADGRICFSLGDVAGKGVPGALIMSRMSSCVQSTMKFCHDPVEAAMAINEHMCDTAVEGRFVTFVLIIIDFANSEMSVVNAGHMSPIIRSPDGHLSEFDDDLVGPPIGVLEDYPYEVDKRIIEPGETVASLQPLFAALREGLIPLVQAIGEKEPPRVDFLEQPYPVEDQLAFALKMARKLGYDTDRGRLDLTVHPFEVSFTRNDVRITTRVNDGYTTNEAVSETESFAIFSTIPPAPFVQLSSDIDLAGLSSGQIALTDLVRVAQGNDSHVLELFDLPAGTEIRVDGVLQSEISFRSSNEGTAETGYRVAFSDWANTTITLTDAVKSGAELLTPSLTTSWNP